jgi:hypothetical protein
MHDVAWHTAPPLWRAALQDRDAEHLRFRRPELLRFASDAFAERLRADLAGGPGALAQRVAQPGDTWDAPASGWLPDQHATDPTFDPDAPLTLYQPAHGRFYLAGAALVCRRTGLPDRRVRRGAGEQVGMVLRRLVPREGRDLQPGDASTYDEYGWFGDAQGWLRIGASGLDRPVGGDGASFGLAEERLPLFPVAYAADGRTRRLLAGTIPVGARERYENARIEPPEQAPPPPALPDDPLADVRRVPFDAFTGALIGLQEAHDARSPDRRTTAWTGEVRDVLAFALLDLADGLSAFPSLWTAVRNAAPSGLPDLHRCVYEALDVPLTGWTSTTWRSAVRDTDAARAEILGGTPTDTLGLPLHVFSAATLTASIGDLMTQSATLPGGDACGAFPDAVEALLGATPPPAWDDALGPDVPARPVAGEVDLGAADAGAVYVVRFVYERPACAPLRPPLVSAPSQPFRMAPFYDPRAPARPIRIPMPVDTSRAGLRRFPKNVSFALSAELRKQMARVPAKLGDLDDGNVDDPPGLSIGMLCSLSIPIITICALILLMLIVQLLNIVFWWLPFFKICLPIPSRS